ncbi:MAG TPA: Hsp70 family protein [Anaerolineaceae bacterium]|nr:Hsp70 family protein [Anaerolineaceae bacterium]HPN50998.1 Hsp70 family protein [Anaerolineaceae bacterium]
MSPIQIIRCPSCGANLSYENETKTTVLCQFCGTSLALPEELQSTGARPAGDEMYTPQAPLESPGMTGLALQIALVDWLLAEANTQTGADLRGQPLAYQRITEAAEWTLRELKKHASTPVELPFLTADQDGPKHLKTTVTREMVDALAQGKDLSASKPAPKKKWSLFGH